MSQKDSTTNKGNGNMKLKQLVMSATLTFVVSPSANAGIIIDANQVGSDVVFDYSGSVNTDGLNAFNTGSSLAAGVGTEPPIYFIRIGPTGSDQQIYTGLTTIAPYFGTGGYTDASSSSGDVFSLTNFLGGAIVVPLDYTSETTISGTMTFSDASISSLNLTPGTYTWTWGSGGNADSATLNIAGAVPEPSAPVLLITLGLSGLGFLGWRRDDAPPVGESRVVAPG
jgi:hypothetical protein